MKDYLLLFRGGDSKSLSEDERTKNMQKWGEWIGGLAKEGKFAGGDPLESGSRIITGRKMTITDGPFAETKELIGGYLIVKAEDLDGATEISKGCPIYEINGATEIREIRHMDM